MSKKGSYGHPTKYDNDIVFAWLVKYKSQHNGNSPTLREMCTGLNISSISVAHHILDGLQKQGRIVLPHKGCNGIEITGSKWVYEP